MPDQKHTPTPWTTSPCPTGGAILHRGGGNSWEHPQGMLQIVPIEDAEFIARAVNSHYELLDALRQVMGWIDNWSPEFTYDEEWPETLHCAEAAIEKAEGR